MIGFNIFSLLAYLILYGVAGSLSIRGFYTITVVIFLQSAKSYKMFLVFLQYYNTLIVAEVNRAEQDSLVSQLLPTQVFEMLKNSSINSKIELTNTYDDVTLLFADIAGFTKYSSTVKPVQVVDMLRSLFTEFDKCCLRYNVYKVYTIGDCYVVLGFLNAAKRNPVNEAKNVVKMGLSMIDIIRTVREKIDFDELDMRIGIHTVLHTLIFRDPLLEELLEQISFDTTYTERMY